MNMDQLGERQATKFIFMVALVMGGKGHFSAEDIGEKAQALADEALKEEENAPSDR